MAGSVVTACVRLAVLAIERNWGTYLPQGAFGPISGQRVKALGRHSSAKGLILQGFWTTDFVIKTFSLPELSACLGSDLAMSPLAPRWLTMLKS